VCTENPIRIDEMKETSKYGSAFIATSPVAQLSLFNQLMPEYRVLCFKADLRIEW
jgi:hypothetical protein